MQAGLPSSYVKFFRHIWEKKGKGCNSADGWSPSSKEIWRTIHALSGRRPYQDTWGPAMLRLIWKEIAAPREGEEEETQWVGVEGEDKWHQRGDSRVTLSQNLPFRWKSISQPGLGNGEANMIGFSWTTWGSTLPEDKGERTGGGEGLAKEKWWAEEESLSQGVFMWKKLGGWGCCHQLCC